MTCGIYCIRNKTSGKRYIGQSKNVQGRLNQHVRDLLNNRSQSTVLQKAWNGYKGENFQFYILLLLPDRLSFLMNALEKMFIFIFKSHVTQRGYNISWGGDTPMKYRRNTDEIKNKISKNNGKYWLGKNHTIETIEKIRKTKLDSKYKASAETKEKQSKSLSGKKQSHGKTSKYVGTYKRNDNGKYRSSIKHLGKVYRSKSYEKEDEAGLAYDELYKQIHNTPFGPNFPNGYFTNKNKEE